MKIEIKPEWLVHPISCTCEVELSGEEPRYCDKPTTAAYPTMGGGWMALCARHAAKHLKHDGAVPTDELISKGAKWTWL